MSRINSERSGGTALIATMVVAIMLGAGIAAYVVLGMNDEVSADTSIHYTERLSVNGYDNALVQKVTDGDDVYLLYQVADIYDYPLAQLSRYIVRGGDDITVGQAWSNTITESCTESLRRAVTVTTGISNTTTIGVKGGVDLKILASAEFSISNATTLSYSSSTADEYGKSLSNGTSNTEQFSISFNPKDWDSNKFYRVELVAAKCEIYQLIVVNKITKEVESETVFISISTSKYMILQHSDTPTFEIPDSYKVEKRVINFEGDLDPAVEEETYIANGSAERPYVIADEDGLKNIKNNMGAHYRLKNDITITNWRSIGDNGSGAYSSFSGTFDGRGFKISMSLQRSVHEVNGTESWAGLFAIVEGGTVKNLKMNLTSIVTDGKYVGGVAGELKNGLITNCSVEGYIETDRPTGRDSYIGGIVGRLSNGNVVACASSAQVAATNRPTGSAAGGIVGTVLGVCEVKYCISTGPIIIADARNYALAGGIVGQGSDGLTVSFCINTATTRTSVTSSNNEDSAGIVGKYGRVENCYFLSGVIYEKTSVLQADTAQDGPNRSIDDKTSALNLVQLKTIDGKYGDGWTSSIFLFVANQLPALQPRLV